MAAGTAAVREVYLELLRVARAYCRSASDAYDVVQDALEIALSRGFDDWSEASRRAWLRGVVKKRAAFLARGQARRLRREQLPDGDGVQAQAWKWQPSFLASLPKAQRHVAALASADLSAVEIRSVLCLSDPALRQRLVALRRALRAAPETPTLAAPAPSISLGGRRAHLLAALRASPLGALATHDPDGHPILLARVPHKNAGHGNSSEQEE